MWYVVMAQTFHQRAAFRLCKLKLSSPAMFIHVNVIADVLVVVM